VESSYRWIGQPFAKMPLTKTFNSPCFGMVTDRFGLGWMVTIPQAPAS
jgi:PhnB protein